VDWKYVGAGKGGYEKAETLMEGQSSGKKRSAVWCDFGINCGNLCCLVCFCLTAFISIYTILVLAGLIPLPNGTKIQMRWRDHLISADSYYTAAPTVSPVMTLPQASNDIVVNSGKHWSSGVPAVIAGPAAAHDITNMGPLKTAVAVKFDCSADFAIWERAWSKKKQEYCCAAEKKGCKESAKASVAFALTAEQIHGCNSECTVSGQSLPCKRRLFEVASVRYAKDTPTVACEKSFHDVISQCPSCKMCPATACLAMKAVQAGQLQESQDARADREVFTASRPFQAQRKPSPKTHR